VYVFLDSLIFNLFRVFNTPLDQIMDLPPPIGLKFPKSVIQEIIDELELKKRQRETPLQRITLTANNTITHVCFLPTLLKIGEFEVWWFINMHLNFYFIFWWNFFSKYCVCSEVQEFNSLTKLWKLINYEKYLVY